MANLNFTLTPGKVWDESGANIALLLSDLNKAFRNAHVAAISGTFDEEYITESDLTGIVAATVANANAVGGIPVLHRVDFSGGSTANYDATLTYKTRVMACWFLLRAAGTSGDKVQLKNSTNAITEAVYIANIEKTPVIIEVAISGGATANYDTVIGDAIRVTDFHAYTRAAGGAASDTITLMDGSSNAVSTALDMNVADTALVRTALINDAYRDFAAGATIRVRQVDGAGSDAPASTAVITGYKTGGNDTYVYQAKTLDDTYYEVAAGGALRVAQTDGGGSDCPAGTAYILGIKVA